MAVAASVLAVTFVVSAAAKLSDQARANQGDVGPTAVAEAADELGLPPLLLTVLPWTELAVAGLLIVATTAGGFLATALLSGFTVFLLGRRRQGPFTCRCFGERAATPVGIWTFARNGLLIGAAALVALG